MFAIYARQSVDREDSISIESQLDFCRYEVRGEACRVYTDRGYSGKNTDRPGFQQLLSDIRGGEISAVVVYKLDRISRSILDFSNLMQLFEEYHVAFVSSTEKFDTSTPMGRAMLNICIVFAQLERETIQKRVADAYFSRSRKSLYMGGRVPYGFRLEQTVLHGVKTARYVLCPAEAALITRIYTLYADPCVSCGDILHDLETQSTSGKPWDKARIAAHLRNPIYVRADFEVYRFFREQGAEIVNDPSTFIGTNGCYLYKNRTADRKTAALSGQQLVLAPHEGFIPADLWLKCRVKSMQNQTARTGRKATVTWLAGKLKCGNCGYALTKKGYNARSAGYYNCSHRQNAHACAGCGTLPADALETLIHREIAAKLELLPILHAAPSAPPPPDTTAQLELESVEREIGTLLDRLSGANEVLHSYINERIVALDARKRRLSAVLCTAPQARDSRLPALSGYLNFWENLSIDDRRRVTDCLIEVIFATSNLVQIKWKF